MYLPIVSRGSGRPKKLIFGVRLEFSHPEISSRDCDDCEKWQYGEDGRRITLPMDGEGVKRAPMKRVGKTPCGICPKLPDPEYLPEGIERTRKLEQSLSLRNRKAFSHYLRCRAVNRWPEDHVVARNAVQIRMIMDASESCQQNAWLAAISSIAKTRSNGG